MSDDLPVDNQSFKIPKDCPSNRYYYRNREAILEKKKLQKQLDPEYMKRKLEREQKRVEKNRLIIERNEKRKLKEMLLLSKEFK